MAAPLVTLEDHGAYACITLRQSVLGAEAQKQLQDILQQTVGRFSAIILTGEGDIFCNGLALQTGKEYSRQGHAQTELVELIRKHPAVFIAAVNGTALSHGVSLINVCDLAIAADTATMALPEITKSTYPTPWQGLRRNCASCASMRRG